MKSGASSPGRLLLSLILLWTAVAILAVACSRNRLPPGQPSSSNSSPIPQAAKIYVTESGYYRIRSQDLSAAGLEITPVQASQIRLYHRGQPVNFWIEEDGRAFTIGFYGSVSDSLYSSESIYWLQVGNSIRKDAGAEPEAMAPVSPYWADFSKSRLAELDTTLAQLHIEENNLYLPQVDNGDHWLWLSLPAPNSTEVELSLPDLAPGQAWLRLSVWAGTSAPAQPDHHLRLHINGTLVADEQLDGIGRHSIDVELSTQILRDGINHLTVEAPGDTGATADIVYLEAVDVLFPRYPVVIEGRIEFISSGETLKFQGFQGPYSVYDISRPPQVSREAENLDPGAPFTGEPGRRYLAVGEPGYKSPARISQVEIAPDLRAPGSGAEYLVVGPARLLEPLDPLIELRSGQGLVTSVVDVQAVYDQFNFGYPEPEALHQFLLYAKENWQPAPRFILLVGDASYDPRGYLATPQANQLPASLVQTDFGGETVSDVDLVQLNDDPWPDLAIGHMPARTPDQVKVLVDKTLDYESSISSGGAKRSIIAIADGQDPSFSDDAQGFLNLFPDTVPRELYAPEAGVVGANQQIKRIFEAGNQMVVYFGHGSVNMWGKDMLFTTEDAGELAESEIYPVVINMTCLTGLYTHPKVESLAEALLWKQAGGAVAVLAPSSLTLPSDQSFLSRALVEAMLADPGARLGEVHLQARRRVPADTSGSLDVMRTFMLFGDPALRLGM